MKKTITATFLVVGFLGSCWFVGCNSFSTRQGSIDSNRMSGLLYYLPKGRIRITGDFAAAGGGGAPAGKTALMGAQTLAPKASDPTGGDSADQKNFVITIAAEVEADPNARYYLKPDRNYFYDDDIRLGVNPKHLLSTGNATAQDQTAQIISTSANLVAQLAGIPSLGVTSFPEDRTMTVSDLLRQILNLASDNNVSLGTKIDVSEDALKNLKGALPGYDTFPVKKKQEIDDALGRLQAKGKTWFTPKEIWDLLRLFESDASDGLVQVGNAKVKKLFEDLFKELGAKKWIPPRPFSIVFDPSSKQPCELLKKPRDVTVEDWGAIKERGFTITVSEELEPEIKLLKEIWEGKNQDVAHGIVFRAVKPYRVTVQSIPGSWFYINESRLMLLPDTCEKHTLVLDYSRLAFVKKTTNVSFVDGIPQGLAQTAPSSVLGFLAIPKGIIQAIVPVPPSVTGPPAGVQAAGVSGTGGAPAASPNPPAQ